MSTEEPNLAELKNGILAVVEVVRSGIYNNPQIGKALDEQNEARESIASGNLEDCYNYAEKIIEVLKLVKNHSEFLSEKSKDIVMIFFEHGASEFEKMLKMFPDDFYLNVKYFMILKTMPHIFCKRCMEQIKDMMLKFSNEPKIFMMASGWFVTISNLRLAKESLKTGLQVNITSKDLCKAIIELELGYPADDSKDRIIEAVSNFVKHNYDYEFVIGIIEMLEATDVKFTVELIEIMKQILLSSYMKEVNVYHYLANKEMKAQIYTPEGLTKPEFGLLPFQKCCVLYQMGISHVPENKKHVLWHYYLNSLIDMYELFPNKDYILPYMEESFVKASLSGTVLSEGQFSMWLEIAIERDDKYIESYIKKAIEKNAEGIDVIWTMYLNFSMIRRDRVDQVKTIFEVAIKALNDKSLEVWKAMIDFLELHGARQSLSDLYERAINSRHNTISDYFKPHYLRFLYEIKGDSLEEVRLEYKRVASMRPHCLELHKEMFLIESFCVEPSEAGIKDVMDLWQEQFGAYDETVYLNKFRLNGRKQNVELDHLTICMEAMKDLVDLEASRRFVEQYPNN